MANIEAVGFDMDYTLAQYNEAFDLLAFEGAKDQLIVMGYPEEAIKAFTFDPQQHCRGLVIDKRKGNFLKMDRHKYVRRAYHGTRELCLEERKAEYVGVAGVTPSFVGGDYVNVDSLFQLVDCSLYAQLVDVLDEGGPSYFQAFTDVRHAVDLCHQDGVIKDQVALAPGKYIIPDENMVPMLTQYRLSGKKVFLLTNSLFDYSNVVMNFLTGQSVNDRDWIDLFDVVVVGAGKPAFLGDSRRDMLRVDAGTNMGTLHNFVGKPVAEVGGPAFLEREGKLYQGGTWSSLHAMLEVKSGGQVLYVGDHMYGDMIRSKRSLGWRTALIVPELEPELVLDAQLDLPLRSLVAEKERECEDAELAVQALRLELLAQGLDFLESEERARSEGAQASARDALKEARDALHRAYHPRWGPLFRSGNQASRFAKQVVDYSCLYTSRASNLLATSPSRNFRPPSDFMPHDGDGARPPM
jgi:HAD superfamily 5'-nucleotidase-like hydrolase